MPPVEREVDGRGVLHLTLRHPPHNRLDAQLRAALLQAFEAAATDPAVRCVLLAADGPLFCGGGDLRELEHPAAPEITQLVQRVASLDKPVGVALHGKVIGAGLLLALACDWRVAAPGTQLCLPEVRLGFIPRAGGTQRLLRAVGYPCALEMIALAKPLPAGGHGVVDAVLATPDERNTWLVDAQLQLAARGARRRLDDRPVPAVDPAERARLRSAAQAEVSRLFPGQAAPLRAIAMLEESLSCDFAQGSRLEQRTYDQLFASEASRRLRAAALA